MITSDFFPFYCLKKCFLMWAYLFYKTIWKIVRDNIDFPIPCLAGEGGVIRSFLLNFWTRIAFTPQVNINQIFIQLFSRPLMVLSTLFIHLVLTSYKELPTAPFYWWRNGGNDKWRNLFQKVQKVLSGRTKK